VSDCPICGSDVLHEITAIDQAERRYLCGNGHGFADVRFRPTRYLPGPALIAVPYGAVLVHCGPPATLPEVPTPQELLDAAYELVDGGRFGILAPGRRTHQA
jgi:hypothetical protein